jgi:multidrug resistance efflux pump
MERPSNAWEWLKLQPAWRLAALAALIIAGVLWFLRDGGGGAEGQATFAARRGPLQISVLEGGSLQALESQEVKCEVRVGYQGTKILRIVEEGYQVTEDDVRNSKVLVELDSSEIQKQLVQQEIQFQSAAASLTDAQQAYDIQLNQNLSDIKAAEQKRRFARMDLDKFLGDSVSRDLADQLGLDVGDDASASGPAPEVVGAGAAQVAAGGVAAAAVPAPAPGELLVARVAPHLALVTNALSDTRRMIAAVGPQPTNGPPGLPTNAAAAATSAQPPQAPSVPIDFSRYANTEALGDGEAKQKLRKLEDDLQVARKEFEQAKATLDGTRRLFERGFVTKTDIQRDEIAHEISRLKVQTTTTARDLFLKYEFIKSAEEALSKYTEADRELDRARKAAVSKLAQAEARLKSAQAQFALQQRQNKDLNEQLEKCIIRAKKPGLVVYGGGRDDMVYYGGEERIREGASVRERQAIITIPDLTRMVVNVKIPETYIKKVAKQQKTRITVDAFPDKVLEGEVTKVGVLPNSQDRWMNPDLKVYLTQITIAGTHDWVKPGMSAKVEILVDRLEDVVFVPIQSIVPEDGKQLCHVVRGGGNTERREVEIGQFNDEFVEVRRGLKEGDVVLLSPRETAAPGEGEHREEPAPAAPPPAAAPAPAAARPAPAPRAG